MSLAETEILSKFLDALPVGVHLYELQGDDRLVFIGSNGEADRILGLDNRQFVGKTVEEAFPPLALTEIPEQYRRVARHGGVWRKEQVTYEDNRITGAFDVHAFQTAPGRMAAAFVDVTRHLKALEERQLALRKAEDEKARAESIIAAIGDGISIQSLDYVVQYQNSIHKAFVGDHVGDFCYKGYEGRDEICGGCPVAEAFADGKTHTAQRTVVRNGSVRHFEITASPLKDAQGRIIAGIEAARDVTERIEAEEDLQREKATYQRLIESIEQDHFVYSHDAQGIFTYLSPSVTKILGYSQEEVKRHYTTYLTDNPLNQEVVRHTELGLQGLKQPPYEVEIFHKDGGIRRLEVIESPVFDQAGVVVALEGIARDITSRKEMEDALRLSRQRFEELSDSLPLAVFEADTSGRVTYTNKMGLEMFGYTPSEMEAGVNIMQTIVLEERGRALSGLQELLAANQTVQSEYTMLRKDGTTFPALIVASVIIKDGAATGVRGVISDVTEQERARKALENSEKTLQTIIEAEPECVKLLDKDGCLILMNRAGLDMIQADSLEQVKGQCVCPMVTGEYREAFMELTSRVFQGERGTLLFEIVGLKGRHLWLETHAVPLRNEQDEIIALLSVTRDVTQQKRNEELLREEESRYRVLFESANDGIFIYDETGFVDCNQRGADMYGLPKEKIIGRSPEDLSPVRQPDGRLSSEVAAEKIQAALAGAPQIFEWQPLRADGAPFDVEVTLNRLVVGGKVCLQAVVRDISERKRAEHALRASETRFRSITEHATVGILVADAETRWIRYANPEICRILGYSDQELRSLRATDLAVREQEPMSVEGFAAHAEGRLQYTERTLRRKDGSAVLMSISSVRMDLEGRPCLVGFLADITERRLMEEERLKMQKLESIGTLAGGIAHDFNNLLQGVFGYISMAKVEYDRKETSLSKLSQAEEALHMAVNLTTQLLTFSKGGKPVKKPIRLAPAIENAVKFALSGSHTGYRLEIAPELWAVEADEGQLAQVIQNIVLNADEAMSGRGDVEITVENLDMPPGANARLPEGGRFVSIEIRDSGIGIPEENLGRIFDPYFTTKRKGSGLGLATSYSIVRNHGGAIEARSEPDRGSTFTIYLPATAGISAAEEKAAPSPAAARKGRILLMDDEEMIRNVATDMLVALGHEVVTATDGQKAMELFVQARQEGRPFDLVILDLTVKGGMGGEATIRRLREIDPDVPAVVSSGYADSPAVADYRDHGFSSVLSKPYKIARLRDCLNELLGNKP